MSYNHERGIYLRFTLFWSNFAHMQTLNLPPAELKLTQQNGETYVFDILRRKYVRLTPEEWVRQHFVHFLIGHKGYPQGLMANEVALSLNSTIKRCDTVLYNRDAHPQLIVEYKAPHIELTQRVFDQIGRYNIVLHVPFLIVSNGLQHYCCHIDYASGQYEFLRDIPCYADVL